MDLSAEDVRHVTLLLYTRTRSKAGYQVGLVTRSWQERRVTYKNAPSISPDFVPSGALRPGAWKAVDVTSLVAGDDGPVSLALTTYSPNAVEIASRETGLHGPRLVVERLQNDTTTTNGQAAPLPSG